MDMTPQEWAWLVDELELEEIETQGRVYVMPLDILVEILPDGAMRVDLAVFVRSIAPSAQ